MKDITWVKEKVLMDYRLGRKGHVDATIAEGTGLFWYVLPGAVFGTPRDRFSVIHTTSSLSPGPYFFSQQDAEHYIEHILPLAEWHQISHIPAHFTLDTFDRILKEMGCEYSWGE